MSAESATNLPVMPPSKMNLQDFIETLKTLSTASQQADFINALRQQNPGVLAEIIDDVPAFVSVLSVLHSEKPDAQRAFIRGLKQELTAPLKVTILGLLKQYSDPVTQAVLIKTQILWDDNPYQPAVILQILDREVHQLFIERLGMSWLSKGSEREKFQITQRDLNEILAQIDLSLAPVLMSVLARCVRTIDEYNHLCNTVIPARYLRLFIDAALPILATTMYLPSDLQAVLFGLPAEESIKVLEFLSSEQWQKIIADETALTSVLSRHLPGGKIAPLLKPKALLALVGYLSPRFSVELGVLENDIYLDGKLLLSEGLYNRLESYVLSAQAGLKTWNEAERAVKQEERDLGVISCPELFWMKVLRYGLRKLAERPFFAVYASGDKKSILNDLSVKIWQTFNGSNMSEQQFQACQSLLQEALNKLGSQGKKAAFLQVAKQQVQALKNRPVSVHREEIPEDPGPSTSSHFQYSR